MKKLIIFYIGFLCICLSAIAKQTLERPRGEHFFTYSQYPPFADRPVDVHYYIEGGAQMAKTSEKYEVMYIIRPDLSEEETAAIVIFWTVGKKKRRERVLCFLYLTLI